MAINHILNKCLFDVQNNRELLYNSNEVKYYLPPTGQLSECMPSFCFRSPIYMNTHKKYIPVNFNFSDTSFHAPVSKPGSTLTPSFLFLR